MKPALILNLFLLSSLAFSTELVLLGGGGDPRGPTTIFDDSLRSLSQKTPELNLKINSTFNGGHEETEKILSSELKVSNQPFTARNYQQVIDDYVRKINSGEIKSGDKLMVIVDTHGSEKSERHQTHSIAMSGSEISGFDRFNDKSSDSMDKLLALSKAAKEKGIKLAIMDFSCHSGNSLPLANEATCVITSAGPKHYGYSNFPSVFYQNMAPGKNLEDVFLETRMKYDSPSFPMISTAAGVEVNNDIYELLSPYLNIVTEDGAADKLSPYLRSLFEGDKLCRRESDYARLLAKLEDFQKVTGALRRSGFFQSYDLIDELKNYKALQDSYLKTLSDMGMPLFERVESISYGQGRNGKLEERLTWREIVTQYPLSSKDYFEARLKETRNASERRELLNTIDKFNKIDLKRQEILRQYPALSDSTRYLSSLRREHSQIWSAASRVSAMANRYYDGLYRQKSQAQNAQKNPCRDFTL